MNKDTIYILKIKKKQCAVLSPNRNDTQLRFLLRIIEYHISTRCEHDHQKIKIAVLRIYARETETGIS